MKLNKQIKFIAIYQICLSTIGNKNLCLELMKHIEVDFENKRCSVRTLPSNDKNDMMR